MTYFDLALNFACNIAIQPWPVLTNCLAQQVIEGLKEVLVGMKAGGKNMKQEEDSGLSMNLLFPITHT